MSNQECAAPVTAEALAELRSLVARAKKGDRAVLPRLHEYLDLNPCLWKRPGDIALQAQAAWIRLIAGRNLHLQECLARRVNAMKQEWAGEAPTPTEALLIERVVSAWLRLHYFESAEAQNDEQSIRWAELRLKQQVQAERQFRVALDALETVRRASRPIAVEIRHPMAVVSQPEPTATGTTSGSTRKAAHTDHVPINGAAVPINRINGAHNGHRMSYLLDTLAVGAEG